MEFIYSLVDEKGVWTTNFNYILREGEVIDVWKEVVINLIRGNP